MVFQQRFRYAININMKQLIAKIKVFFNQRNKRESLILSAVVVLAITYGFMTIVTEVSDYLAEKDLEIDSRMEDLKNVSRTLNSYHSLKDRVEGVKTAYAAAQMSFEKAYSNLDNLVKKSVGAEVYNLKTKGVPADIGLGYEKQDYTLIVTLNRDQLVKLLFELEQGKSGLFLKQVRVSNKQGNSFEAQLDIYSIIKSKS